MIVHIKAGYLLCCAIAIALAAGNASAAEDSLLKPETVSGVDHLTRGASFRVMELHLLNIGEDAKLREHMQRALSMDVLALSELLQQYKLSADERARAQKILTLIAVQNERFPVSEWIFNEQVIAVLKRALAENPAYAEQLRARNWSKPMWQK